MAAASKSSQACFNNTRGKFVAREVRVAKGLFSRLKGLLGTKALQQDAGLYITPCTQIHMIGMSYPIDAVFLDKKGNVVGLAPEIPPGRISACFWRAAGCLELPAGTISDTGTQLGDSLTFGEPLEFSSSR